MSGAIRRLQDTLSDSKHKSYLYAPYRHINSGCHAFVRNNKNCLNSRVSFGVQRRVVNSDCGLSLRRLSCSFADLVSRALWFHFLTGKRVMLGQFEPGKSISTVKHAFLKSQNGKLVCFWVYEFEKKIFKRLYIISSVIFQICSFYT